MVNTNITDDQNGMYSIDDFNSVFLNRVEGEGGIAVFYIKKPINIAITQPDTKFFESIEINIHMNGNLITLLPIYRKPSLHINMFIMELENFIHGINKKQAIILIGDANMDSYDI